MILQVLLKRCVNNVFIIDLIVVFLRSQIASTMVEAHMSFFASCNFPNDASEHNLALLKIIS